MTIILVLAVVMICVAMWLKFWITKKMDKGGDGYLGVYILVRLCYSVLGVIGLVLLLIGGWEIILGK